MLRLTGDTLVVSFLRFGLAVVGPGLSDKAMASLDTCTLNVLARKILEVSRTARIPILFALSGVLSTRNLFIQRCARMAELGFRASNSILQGRLGGRMRITFNMSSRGPDTHKLQLPLVFPPHIVLRYLDFHVGGSWRFDYLHLYRIPRLGCGVPMSITQRLLKFDRTRVCMPEHMTIVKRVVGLLLDPRCCLLQDGL